MARRYQLKRSDWSKVVNEGMGSFLNPPTHPEHKYSVKSVYGNTFFLSLSAAIEADWIEAEVKHTCRYRLNKWAKENREKEPDKEWVQSVLGYFKGCYQGPNGEWEAAKVTIDLKSNPLFNQDKHCGVNFIRKFYPGFVATNEHFNSAKWGN